MPDIKLIAAIDEKRGIAAHGKLAWNLPTDRAYFRKQVQAGPVVMGWNTFTNNNFKPYGDGPNTVITRRKTEAFPGVWVVHDAEEYFKTVGDDIWVAGGGQIYAEALPYATHLYLTDVKGDHGCDTFFPDFTQDFMLRDVREWQTENDTEFRYTVWVRK